jgi:hypothetical protein
MTQVKIRPTTAQGPVVKILINGSASYAVSVDRIKARGVAVAALVEAIHLSGANATVTVMYSQSASRNSSARHLVTLVDVKTESSPLDIDAMMFAVAHPSMLRRIMFAAWETESATIRKEWGLGGKYGGGYGFPRGVDSLPAERRAEYSVTIDKPGAYETSNIENDPVQWVADTLKGVGLLDAE